MKYLIELIVGASLLVVGILGVSNQRWWRKWFNHMEQNIILTVTVAGITDVLIGEIIILFHWVFNSFGVFITVIGLVLLIRGGVRLLLSECITLKIIDIGIFLRVDSFIFITISSIALYSLVTSTKFS